MTTAQTILIGIDGATFTILDPLMQDGVMPFLDEFTKSGIRAPLRTVIPALTPPAWTSLVTGRSPGQHGIFDFFRKESAESHKISLMTSRDILTDKSIWSLANQHGLRAIALNFPLTFPAPNINGYVVPGWMPWKQLRLACHPKNLYEKLKLLPDFNPRELAMDMTLEAKALEGCEREEYGEWIQLHARREKQWLEIVRLLLNEENSCELITVLLDGVDKLQHLCWRFIDPGYASTLKEPWEIKTREACLDYFRQLDEIIAEIVQMAGPEATVILASDHGFGAQEQTFFANAWLAQNGYLRWAETERPQSSESRTLGVDQIARHGSLIDWQHTRAYAPLPSGNGIHIVRQSDDHPNGVTERKYEAFRENLIAELLALRTPESNRAVVAEVWRREEIFDGPCLELAPDLTLVMQDGGLISILDSEMTVEVRSQPVGTHRPDGILIASGPQFLSNTRLNELSILDVAPLILHSLNIPLPEYFEGELATSALDPISTSTAQRETLPANIVELSSTTSEQPELLMNEEAEAVLMQRLRALGYVE